MLRERAQAGSVSAAVALSKMAIDQRTKQAVSCVNHLDEADVDDMISGIVELFTDEFSGPFVRSCGAMGVFGVDVHVADSLERVKQHFERLAEQEREAVPA